MAIDLSKEIAKALSEYTNDVKKDIKKIAKDVARDGANKLKTSGPKRSGNYRGSWGVKSQKDGQQVIHNKKHYQLTHLLEKSHATRNGGRTKPIVHIKPVEEEVIRDFEHKVEERIRRGN